MHHFSVTNAEGNVARLLRKIVETIEQLGEVEVHDVTFCAEVVDGTFPVTMTVYLSFPEDDGDDDS